MLTEPPRGPSLSIHIWEVAPRPSPQGLSAARPAPVGVEPDLFHGPWGCWGPGEGSQQPLNLRGAHRLPAPQTGALSPLTPTHAPRPLRLNKTILYPKGGRPWGTFPVKGDLLLPAPAQRERQALPGPSVLKDCTARRSPARPPRNTPPAQPARFGIS